MASRTWVRLTVILMAALASSCSGSPSSPSGSSACNWVGTWQVSTGVRVTAAGDGSQTALVGQTTFSQTWSISGTTYSVTDRSASGGLMGACPASQVGTYTITFSNSCNTAQFAVLTEPCDGRRPFIAGSTAARQ